MKKYFLCICLGMLMLCGCSFSGGNGGETDAADVPGSVFSGCVAAVEHDTAYLSGDEGGDLISLSLKEIAITNETGDTLAAEDVRGGMTVEVAFDGMIMESYPSMLSNPTKLTIEKQGWDVVGLYRQAIRDIYEEDPGLNGNTYAAFDLTKAANLTEGEKSALIYLVGNDLKLETLSGTMESLAEEGYIDEENLFFEDGVLITIGDEEPDKEGDFSFDIQKWRSGTGAIFYQDCKAVWDGEAYSYEVGGFAIS